MAEIAEMAVPFVSRSHAWAEEGKMKMKTKTKTRHSSSLVKMEQKSTGSKNECVNSIVGSWVNNEYYIVVCARVAAGTTPSNGRNFCQIRINHRRVHSLCKNLPCNILIMQIM